MTGVKWSQRFTQVRTLLLLLLQCIPITIGILYRKIFKKDRKKLNGEVVLITGAGQGLGRELARVFGREGSTVVCVDVNASTNAATADLLKKAGYSAFDYACDVSERANVVQLASRVLKDVGRVDILVNNAGILNVQSASGATNEDRMVSFMKINTLSHFWTAQAFLPGMLERDHGHVVGIASMAGLKGLASGVTYAASKAAIGAFMMSLDNELHLMGRKNIKVSCVYPYYISTPLINDVFDTNCLFPAMNVEDAAAEIVDGIKQEKDAFVVPKFLELGTFLSAMFPKEINSKIREATLAKLTTDPYEICSAETYTATARKN